MRHAQDQMKKITGGLRRVCGMLLILALTAAGAMAQTVSGVVTETNGTPMVGVNVAIKGTSRGVVTDIDGKYRVEAAADATLMFSSIGFVRQEIAVDGRTSINLTMELDVETLNEVVVVGYGVQKKSDLTGAIASVDRDNLQQLATTSPMQALQGQVSGVQIVNNSGAPASGVKVRIRGVGTINNSDPLYIVDGYPTNDISNIPPSDIENMEVLKDASATAIYGSRGANGVIIISTRRGSQEGAQFEFNAYTGMQTAWNRLDLLNATEYAELRMEAFANDGMTANIVTTE
ncbi:MAG: TonB-dependent receptor plug domain-containing protein [Bacteroidota bacterium]